MLKMVDGTGIIGVDMVCPLGGTVSPPQPPNYDKVEVEGVGSLTLPNSLKAPLERVELIGNSVQGENPAPDNPQEIKSAGRKSKNLFNIADLRVGQVQKDGTINEKSTYCRTAILDVPEDGKYRITFNSNDDYTMLYFTEAYANGVYSNPYVKVYGGNSGSLISLKNGKNILSFRATKDNAIIDFPKDHNIMIAAESETLDYEPYGYFLDLKITGKNLLSNKPTDWMIGKTTSWGAVPQTPVSYGKNVKNAIATINVKSSTNYSFINKETNKLWVCRIIELDANGLGLVNHALYANESFNYKKYNFSTRSNTANIVFEIKKVDGTELLSSDIESIKIMLVEGEANESTIYQPYTEQTLTLASNRPITKWDKLVEQGGEYGWLYQSASDTDVMPSRLDLFPNGFSLFKDFDNGAHVYKVTNIKKAIGFQTSLCEQFKNKDGSYSTGDLFCYSDQPSMQMQYFVTDIPTLEEFKTWMETNPLTMVYQTVESQFIPLSESEQTQLRNLHSYNGTTNIMVDSGEVPCGIKLTYRKEK